MTDHFFTSNFYYGYQYLLKFTGTKKGCPPFFQGKNRIVLSDFNNASAGFYFLKKKGDVLAGIIDNKIHLKDPIHQ